MEGWPYSTFPTGWYQVEWSSRLGTGEVKSVRFFDTELVIYRTEAGVAQVIDAFCPHLGAHIGHGGCVKGEVLACPWHGWEWDLQGRNTHIPFVDRVNPTARLLQWETREIDGLIIVWYDATGERPTWEFPGVPEFSDHDGYYEPLEVVVGPETVKPQQPRENTADLYHFPFVHGSGKPSALDVVEERGHILYETMNHELGEGRETTWLTPNGPITSRIVTYLYALGIGVDRIEVDETLRTAQTVCVTPVNASQSLFFSTCTANRVPGETEPTLRNRRMMESQHLQIMNDFDVWANQRYVQKPLYSDAAEGRAISRFRRWANQFYPADNYQPGMVVDAEVVAS